MKMKNKQMMLALPALLGTLSAHAASGVNIHSVTAGSGIDYTLSEDALLRSKQGLSLGLSYDYANDPLVVMNADRTKEVGQVVRNLHTFDLMARYRISSRFAFGLGLPIHMTAPMGQANRTVPGDLRAFVKMRTNDIGAKRTAFAVQLDGKAPTGNAENYVSDNSVGVGLSLLGEHDFGFMQLAANAGYFYSYNATVAGSDLDYRHLLPISLSTAIPVGQKWAINAELGGKLSFSRYQNPGEFYLGGRFHASDKLTVYAGAGLGNVGGNGSNDYRISAGLRASFGSDAKDEIVIVKAAPVVAPAPVQKPMVVVTPKKLEIRDEIRFHFDSDRLTDSGMKILDEVATAIKGEAGKLKVVGIEGHTDQVGGREYNQKLSEKRAKSVRAYLVKKGISPSILTAEGFGKEMPKSKFDPENRRVEFNVYR